MKDAVILTESGPIKIGNDYQLKIVGHEGGFILFAADIHGEKEEFLVYEVLKTDSDGHPFHYYEVLKFQWLNDAVMFLYESGITNPITIVNYADSIAVCEEKEGVPF